LDSTQAQHLTESLQGKTVGGWHIDGFFGNGKSAVVLPASQGGVDAAIKIFHPELIERYGKTVQLERILREKSLVGAEHPNLVRILDGGECPDTGYLYVVMERLPYRNLHEVLKDIPVDAPPQLISQIASAARFLEDRGQVHRDIKPENIAVTDDFKKAILLDLGVLRPIGLSNLTDVDQRSFIGTLRYSSPEFLVREECDTLEGWRAVTFYQLGAVLHDMLMKVPLFQEYSEPFSRLVEAVKTVVPKIHSDDSRSVSLANHCLVKDPTTRLELVTWADFSDEMPQGSAKASAARERIKQRQKYFQASTHATTVPVADARRMLKQALDDLCNRFESRVAALMNDLQCFPLRTTKSEKDVDAKRSTTCVQFEADEEMGLPYRLTLMFEISMIDENNGAPIYDAAASAVLSHDEQGLDQMKPTNHFFTGEIQELLDGSVLEKQFLDAIEEAYRTQERGQQPPAGGLLRLIAQSFE
jgi:eukaryotic-like serine/threonine-protein kinase